MLKSIKSLIKRLTTWKRTERSSGQKSVEEANSLNSGEQLVSVREVEGTPFKLVMAPEITGPDRVFIGIGQGRITEPMTEKEALRMINERDWGLIWRTIAFIGEKVAKQTVIENQDKTNI